MEMFSTSRLPNETDVEYIFRICSNKENIGTWEQIACLINQELGTSFTESYYRKRFRKQEAPITMEPISASTSKEEELFRLKKQIQDQRREYRKDLTRAARYEHLLETVADAAQKLGRCLQYTPHTPTTQSDKNTEACLFLADWHYGMTANTPWNTYNTSVCQNRVTKLLYKATAYLKKHSPSKLHIVILGDMANGGIHCSSRVASEELVCEQIMHVSELLAESIEILGGVVPEVIVYTCYGNHMRTIQDKHDSIHADNMERLLPWWLKWRLKEYDNINIVESDSEFNIINVCGYNVGCVHGDLDSLKSVGITLNTLLNHKTGQHIDYTVSADKHHHEEVETSGIENIIVRSLCGTDDYAHGRRLYSTPGQTLMFFTPEDGRQCTYNIKL